MVMLLSILCPMMLMVGLFGGSLLERVSAREELRPRLMNDNVYTRVLTGGHALLFGPDGEIVEAEWYSPRRSAKEFGGKARDYSFGWIDHESDEVSFKPIGILPMPLSAAPGEASHG
ncbi:hypothetical protein [Brevundimonas sp.]|uniref:hypothetical protein n=1 Tax=Brevundimonas sp. TaxID=1871086 RepID=UPI0028963462|nr:hypothetical protein [Brevundimonas sp.]